MFLLSLFVAYKINSEQRQVLIKPTRIRWAATNRFLLSTDVTVIFSANHLIHNMSECSENVQVFKCLVLSYQTVQNPKDIQLTSHFKAILHESSQWLIDIQYKYKILISLLELSDCDTETVSPGRELDRLYSLSSEWMVDSCDQNAIQNVICKKRRIHYLFFTICLFSEKGCICKKKKKYVCNCHGYVQYTVCNKICACIKMLPEEKCIHFKFKV